MHDEKEKWDPANPKKLAIATMNSREFNAWCDAGRPPLEPPAARRATMEATLQARLEKFADLLGKEIGQIHQGINAEIAVLRAEHRRELDALHAKLRQFEPDNDAVDLPNWRSHDVDRPN
jgi:hypothetical protein